MYLKRCYMLGYETLCKEVSDSFTWRRFCRIALDGRVPDLSMFTKLTKRLGPERRSSKPRAWVAAISSAKGSRDAFPH